MTSWKRAAGNEQRAPLMRSEDLLGEMHRWQVIKEVHIRPGHERDEVFQARGETFPEQLQVE